MSDPLRADLGSYLRSVRERTPPERVGLVSRGTRRVPGLRREEVALLAGVSPTYYTRLEQSQATHASPAVLRAIAGALGLSDDDQAYLLKIGTADDTRAVREPADSVNRYTGMLVGSLRNAAVAVVNHRCDVLAWNPVFHQLFAPHLPADAPDRARPRPNVVRMNFLDDRVRALYPDPDVLFRSNVAYLRFVAADHRDDTDLAALVAELTGGSAEFARLWHAQHVENCANGRLELDHPRVGRLEVLYESADLRDGNVIKFYHVEPGSPSEVAFELLAPERSVTASLWTGHEDEHAPR